MHRRPRLLGLNLDLRRGASESTSFSMMREGIEMGLGWLWGVHLLTGCAASPIRMTLPCLQVGSGSWMNSGQHFTSSANLKYILALSRKDLKGTREIYLRILTMSG